MTPVGPAVVVVNSVAEPPWAFGLLLLLADLFITSGVLAVLALAAVVIGLVFVFRYDTAAGVVAFAGVFVGVPLVGGAILRFWPGLVNWRRGHEVGAYLFQCRVWEELPACAYRTGGTQTMGVLVGHRDGGTLVGWVMNQAHYQRWCFGQALTPDAS